MNAQRDFFPDPNDVGWLIGKQLDDAGRKLGLLERWVPKDTKDFPVSWHTKNNKCRQRRVTPELLSRIERLALSQCPERQGVWCTFCVLFITSSEVGGRYDKSQKLGKLVLRPLTDFSCLTGKEGALDTHEKSSYHQRNKIKAVEFLASLKSQSSIIDRVSSQNKQ